MWIACCAVATPVSDADEAGISLDSAPPRPSVMRVEGVGPEDALQAVAVAGGGAVVVVGAKGLVFASSDSGRTWRRRAISGRPPFIDVTACPNGRFFLLDFRRGLWRRDAGDGAWARVVIAVPGGDTAPRSLALRCDSQGRLWAVGEESSILRSDDGGRRWRSTHPDRSDRLLTAVGFAGAERIRVVGEFGSYFESDDAGEHWRRGPDIPGELYPHAAHVAADGRVWVVGATGHAYRLEGPGGWVEESSGTNQALYGIARVGTRLVAVGAGETSLLRRKEWARLALKRPPGVARHWRGVADLGGDAFVAVGAGGVARVELLARSPERAGPAAQP